MSSSEPEVLVAPRVRKSSKKDNPYQWKPGQSGNPAGRPKGAKNAITLLKQSLELQLREQSNGRLPQVLEKAIDLALNGDRSMIKLLLELHMTKGSSEESKATEKAVINIASFVNTDKETKTSISALPNVTVIDHTPEKETQDNGQAV